MFVVSHNIAIRHYISVISVSIFIISASQFYDIHPFMLFGSFNICADINVVNTLCLTRSHVRLYSSRGFKTCILEVNNEINFDYLIKQTGMVSVSRMYEITPISDENSHALCHHMLSADFLCP